MLRKRILPVLLGSGLLICAFNGSGQQSANSIWNVKYDYYDHDDLWSSIVPCMNSQRNYDYLAIANNYTGDVNDGTYHGWLVLNFMSENGTLMDRSIIEPAPGHYSIQLYPNNAICDLGAQGFLLLTIMRDSARKANTCLIGLSANGDSLFSVMYSDSLEDLSLYNIQHTANNELIMAGQYGSSLDASPVLIRTDINGVEIWRTYLNSTWMGFIGLVEASNGDILTTTHVRIGNNTHRILLSRFTSSGTLVWSMLYPQFATDDSAGSIIELDDGNFALSGSTCLNAPNIQEDRNPLLVIVDGQGNVLNYNIHLAENSIDDLHIDIVQHPNGTILTCGYFLDGIQDDVNSWGHVTAFHENGDFWWRKLLKYEDVPVGPYFNWFTGIILGNDDQLVCVGYTRNHSINYQPNEYFRDLWVVKVDTVAPLSSITGIAVQPSTSAAFIYPNPATFSFRVSAVQLGIDKIIIRDLLGRQVLARSYNSSSENVEVDVRTLPNGNYFVQVVSDQEIETLTLTIAK